MPPNVYVDAMDQWFARANPTNNADVTNAYDYNKDGVVDYADEAIAQGHPEIEFYEIDV